MEDSQPTFKELDRVRVKDKNILGTVVWVWSTSEDTYEVECEESESVTDTYFGYELELIENE